MIGQRTTGLLVALVVLAGLTGSAAVAPSDAPGSTRPDGARVRVLLTLHADAAGLLRFAHAVSTPGSPQFHRFEDAQSLSRRFGPSRPARQLLLAYLRRAGASGVRFDATGLFAEASLPVRAAAALLSAAGGDGRSTSARLAAIGRVPRALAGVVTGVLLAGRAKGSLAGMLASPQDARTASGLTRPQASSELPHSGTAAGCGAGEQAGEIHGHPDTAAFTPNQYLAAYRIADVHALGLTGNGQRVALIEQGSVRASDLAGFAACFGFRAPHVNEYVVGGGRAAPPGEEATVDAEVLAAAAPGLAAIDVYQTRSDATDFLAALTAPLQHPGRRTSVISVSIGLCDPAARAVLGVAGLQTSQLALAAATASGVTVVAAAGDTGSAGCERVGQPPARRLAVLYPASSWFVTAVGGTNIALAPDNTLTGEIAWNDAGRRLAAGGGGFSSIWTRPPFQVGAVKVDSRAVPDIAMLADSRPGYAVLCSLRVCHSGASRGWISVGGTSLATPLVAGSLALIDEALTLEHRNHLGNLNELLYTLGAGGPFNDVVAGSNDVGAFLPGSHRPLGCCAAHRGFDEATGWGSVDLRLLLSQAVLLSTPYIGTVAAAIVAHQRPVAAGKLLVKVRCGQPCVALADGVFAIGKGTPVELVSPTIELSRRGSRIVALSFPAGERAAMRTALRHHVRVIGIVYGILESQALGPGGYVKQTYSAPVPITLMG